GLPFFRLQPGRAKVANEPSPVAKAKFSEKPGQTLTIPYFCGMSKFDEQLQMLVLNALQEDVGDGDHSTLACIPPQARGKAVLHIKQDGILAGMEIAEKILR